MLLIMCYFPLLLKGLSPKYPSIWYASEKKLHRISIVHHFSLTLSLALVHTPTYYPFLMIFLIGITMIFRRELYTCFDGSAFAFDIVTMNHHHQPLFGFLFFVLFFFRLRSRTQPISAFLDTFTTFLKPVCKWRVIHPTNDFFRKKK